MISEASGEKPDPDLGPLLEAMGGDAGRLAACVTVFCRQMPHDLAAIQQAMAAGEGARLAAAAHAMRGAVSLVGARQLTDLTRRIEQLARQEALSQAAEVVVALSRETRRCLAALEERHAGAMSRARSAPTLAAHPAG